MLGREGTWFCRDGSRLGLGVQAGTWPTQTLEPPRVQLRSRFATDEIPSSSGFPETLGSADEGSEVQVEVWYGGHPVGPTPFPAPRLGSQRGFHAITSPLSENLVSRIREVFEAWLMPHVNWVGVPSGNGF